jgi:hypothetical protein
VSIINEIHHKTIEDLENDAIFLRDALRGHLSPKERTAKTDRLQLTEAFLRIKGGLMTTDDFKSAQQRLGLTNKKMAELICVSLTHLENLRRGYKLDGGKRVDVLATTKIIRIIEQAEQLQALKTLNDKA